MRNGNTTFYAFTQDGTMSLLLSTSPTVDSEKDTTNGAIFENGRLSAYIRQSENESEYSEIVFVGRVYIYGVKNNDTAGHTRITGRNKQNLLRNNEYIIIG